MPPMKTVRLSLVDTSAGCASFFGALSSASSFSSAASAAPSASASFFLLFFSFFSFLGTSASTSSSAGASSASASFLFCFFLFLANLGFDLLLLRCGICFSLLLFALLILLWCFHFHLSCLSLCLLFCL